MRHVKALEISHIEERKERTLPSCSFASFGVFFKVFQGTSHDASGEVFNSRTASECNKGNARKERPDDKDNSSQPVQQAREHGGQVGGMSARNRHNRQRMGRGFCDDTGC